MYTSTDNKAKLLLSPQQLSKNTCIVQSFHINKSPKGTTHEAKELDSREINGHLADLPKQAREVLLQFNEDHAISRDRNIRTKFKSGRTGIAFKDYYRTALLREIHGLFERLKPFTPLIKWYHKIWIDQGNAKTAACVFSNYKPQLSFEVLKENERLHLKTNILLNDTAFGLTQFDQYEFLLLSSSEYFLLSFKDYQTILWVKEMDPDKYCSDPQALAEQVLSRLEENYKVNRNGHFTENIIETAPLNRVMLSEISGSFLVLTPQFLYDGFLVDGPWKETYEISKAGEAFVIKRNREAELHFSKLLQGMHPNFIKQLNGYYYLSFGDAQKKQWFLKAYHSLLNQDIQVVGMDMLQHFRYSTHKGETLASISENDDNTLTVKLSLSFGSETIPLHELQKILLAGQKAILLKDGSLGVLGDEWLHQYGAIIKHGKISNNALIVAKWMALTEEKTSLGNEVLKPVITKDWWKLWQKWQQPGELLYAVPQGIEAVLRPYQQKGFEWMALLAEAGAGACLADDMGLGKTLQAICLLAHRYQQDTERKFLIVCPSSLLYNWVQELQKFAPNLSNIVYHGPQRIFEVVNDKKQCVVITTYGTMRSDIEKIATVPFDIVLIDESHNIKNPSALITRAVNQLTATIRIALSGTPVMNNTFDLYAQLSFLLPGMFGTREFFKREYADAIDRDQDVEKIKALQKLTAPFILRRTKEQVAPDLPEKMESILWCNMGAEQQLVYESIKESVRNSIFLDIKEKGINSGKLSVINGLLKLRQVCNSAALVKDDRLNIPASIKTDILIDELKNLIPNHKVLVFSQFTSMLDLLEASFEKHHITFFRLDGSTPVAKRQEMVNRFQQDAGGESVFLISLKAGNAGLNLTAADYVFLFDPWWNTAVQQQAIDRTHRIGQMKNVFAYKMICKDTIEEKIMQLQQRKKKLAEELIGEEEGFVKALTENDIEFLFS